MRYDGEVFQGRAWMVAAANTRLFGGGMRIAPGASVRDNRLDLVIVRDMPRHRLLRRFPSVYRGRHLGRPEVLAVRAEKVTIRAREPLTFYGDGERMRAGETKPIEIRSVPAALRVVAPGEVG